jgi:hypothetical protein
MPDTKISQLPEATVALGDMELVVNDSGVSRKLAVRTLREHIQTQRLTGNANNFPAVTIPSGVTSLRCSLFVVAPGSVVPRLRLGGSAIDSGNNYASQTFVSTSATNVSRTAYDGINLAHAALLNTNQLLVDITVTKAAASRPARIIWQASALSIASNSAPLYWGGSGIWVNTADSLGIIQVIGVSTLTGATAANMGADSEFVVRGINEA